MWRVYLPSVTPKAWLSRLRIENCDLTPTHACVPISHAWWKRLSHYSLNQLILKKIIKYLNKLEPMRENIDDTFAKSRVLVGKVTGDMVCVILNGQSLGFTGHKSERLRNVFGNLRTTSEIVRHLRILSVPYEKSWRPQDKNVTPMNHKKLAGIEGGHGGVVVSTLDCRSEGGWFDSGPWHYVVSLDKKHYPHCLPTPRCINGYQWHTAGGNPVMD